MIDNHLKRIRRNRLCRDNSRCEVNIKKDNNKKTQITLESNYSLKPAHYVCANVFYICSRKRISVLRNLPVQKLLLFRRFIKYSTTNWIRIMISEIKQNELKSKDQIQFEVQYIVGKAIKLWIKLQCTNLWKTINHQILPSYLQDGAI